MLHRNHWSFLLALLVAVAIPLAGCDSRARSLSDTSQMNQDPACFNVICPPGQMCLDGACVASDPCVNVVCPMGQTCDQGLCTVVLDMSRAPVDMAQPVDMAEAAVDMSQASPDLAQVPADMSHPGADMSQPADLSQPADMSHSDAGYPDAGHDGGADGGSCGHSPRAPGCPGSTSCGSRRRPCPAP